MVPRVDIVAIAADTPLDEVVRLIQAEAHSRYPIYRELLDDVIGMIHIKDVLAYWGTSKKFNLRDILRRVVFVAPTLPVLDMLLDMRRSRTHMALVVDEFGGTDGLLTIEDLVEEIVGEIEDEHDVAQTPTVARRVDGTIDVNGRTPIEMLEQEIGRVLSEDERREIDTVGGLIFSLLGRIPERGEVVRHPSGVEFESARCRSAAHPPPARAAADVVAVRRLIDGSRAMKLQGWRAHRRGVRRGRARRARHAAALLAAAGRAGHRGRSCGCGMTRRRRAARFCADGSGGIGHFAVGSYWILEAFFVPPADYQAARAAHRARAGGDPGLLPGRLLQGSRAGWCRAGPHLAGRYRRLILLALAWTVAEWVRGHLFTGYPWNPLGHVWAFATPLLQGAALFGVYGLGHFHLPHPRGAQPRDGGRRSPHLRRSASPESVARWSWLRWEHRRPRTGPWCASCSPMSRRRRNGVQKPGPGNSRS